MKSKSYPFNVLEQALDILAACKEINPQLQLGTLTVADFADTLARAQATMAQLSALDLQRANVRNRRDEELAEVWSQAKRIRALVKAQYGDDSSEYDLVGGTRLRDRKKATLKTTGEEKRSG